jgi:putative oxidoreductase
MKIVAILCRILLGLLFVVFGLNGFLNFIPMGAMPPAGSPPAQFMGVMGPSGWLHFVSAMQVLGGLLVLIGGTTPLGLVILGPIIVNIWCFHLLLAGGHGLGPGAFVAVLEIVLIYAYRANFWGIFTVKATPTP